MSACFFSSEGGGPTLELVEGREFAGIISFVKRKKETQNTRERETNFKDYIEFYFQQFWKIKWEKTCNSKNLQRSNFCKKKKPIHKR